MDQHALIEVVVGAIVAAIVAVSRLVPRNGGGITRRELDEATQRVIDRIDESDKRADRRTDRALIRVKDITEDVVEGREPTPPRRPFPSRHDE